MLWETTPLHHTQTPSVFTPIKYKFSSEFLSTFVKLAPKFVPNGRTRNQNLRSQCVNISRREGCGLHVGHARPQRKKRVTVAMVNVQNSHQGQKNLCLLVVKNAFRFATFNAQKMSKMRSKSAQKGDWSHSRMLVPHNS